jgi:hypothetical protein
MAKRLIYYMIGALKRQRAPAFLSERSALLSERKKHVLLLKENKH